MCNSTLGREYNNNVNLKVAMALRRIDSYELPEFVIRANDNHDNFVRSNNVRRGAVEALGKIGNDKAVGPLILALKDPYNDDVRWYAVKALGEIGSDKAVEALILDLKDSDYDVRRNALAEALSEIAQNDRNLPTLTKQLPHLLTLIPTEASQQALSVITAIQARCKYYNYDIAQTSLPPEDNPNPTTGNTYNFHGKVGQVVGGNLIVQGDNIATQNTPKTAPES